VIVLGKVTWDFRRHGKSTWGNDFLLQPEMKQVGGRGLLVGACEVTSGLLREASWLGDKKPP